MKLDITQHPNYLKGQSKEWCQSLAKQTGKYEYTWNYEYEGEAAEDTLTETLEGLLHGKVLDVGCGHGEYTNRWGDHADEMVGYDMTEGFIATANRDKKQNTRFIVGHTHEGLPFPDAYFNVAYTKKGPTSWYNEGNRVVRPGGRIVLFHPGDGNGEGGELAHCFPGLFAPSSLGTPILDIINERLNRSGFINIELRTLRETIWIPTPEDVVKMLCFGQSSDFARYIREAHYSDILTRFERHAGKKGIQVTNFYYFIQAKAGGRLEL
ncbi:methyltransferase domain-containing protein [Paenibacillus sp. RC67]|uniref:class I SAM-dependent methyltransferase n=1 Tax=Paenibacillus sp. RC67 TaxID=3039392 RepID=UPI0024AD2EBF|nr:methyltransferase domain-containing protein [Paenibacillus sp. RC67]